MDTQKIDQRNLVFEDCWIDVADEKPAPRPEGKHYPVTVLGVIDDRDLRIEPDSDYVDVVSYWPALDVFTVTHSCRADADADDFRCRVRCWQPMVPTPRRFKRR